MGKKIHLIFHHQLSKHGPIFRIFDLPISREICRWKSIYLQHKLSSPV